MKTIFLDIETTIKTKLGSIVEKLTQRHIRRKQAGLDGCDNETCTSTQFLQIPKKQLFDPQEPLESCCHVLPIFGFNIAIYDLNLINSVCYPFLLTNVTLNLLLSKKRTSLFRSNSAIFSRWIL